MTKEMLDYRATPLMGHVDHLDGLVELNAQRFITCSSDLRVCLWDSVSGELVREHDSDWVSVGGVEKISENHALVWGHHRAQQFTLDSRQGRLVTQWRQGFDGIKRLRSLKNGTVLSLSDDLVLRLHDALTGECLSTCLGVQRAEILSNGQIAGWSGRRSAIRIWSDDLSERVAHLEGHTSHLNGVVLLGQGDLLGSWDEEPEIKVWDLLTEQCRTVLSGHRQTTNEERYHCNAIGGVQSLPNGRALSWSADETLRIWDVAAGHALYVLEGHEGPVTGALVLPDQRIFSWGFDENVFSWDSNNGQSLERLVGHKGVIIGFVQMRSGHFLSWSVDQTLRVWNSKTGRCVSVLEGHSDYILGVLELANGNLVSWSENGEAILWKTS